MVRRPLVAVLFAGCSVLSVRVPCEELEPLDAFDVDTSTGVPVFSWSPADQLQEDLRVVCDPADGFLWSVGCSVFREGPPVGTVCLASPITYGEAPSEAAWSNGRRTLEPGASCEATVRITCDDGDVGLTKSFIAP